MIPEHACIYSAFFFFFALVSFSSTATGSGPGERRRCNNRRNISHITKQHRYENIAGHIFKLYYIKFQSKQFIFAEKYAKGKKNTSKPELSPPLQDDNVIDMTVWSRFSTTNSSVPVSVSPSDGCQVILFTTINTKCPFWCTDFSFFFGLFSACFNLAFGYPLRYELSIQYTELQTINE